MIARDENLSSADFERLRVLIHQQSGIVLNAEKRTMLEIRIKRRLRALGSHSFAEYCDYVFGPEGRSAELTDLIDAVTTNKTDFFREAHQFEYLRAKVLPALAFKRKVLIWSAGCSTGEEPYTLAMVLNEFAECEARFDFEVLATDISTAVLAQAQSAVYKAEAVDRVPAALRRKYFMRSRDPASDLMRVVPELRRRVQFRRVNFMDGDLGVPETLDVIFCRNVIIYFDHGTKMRTLHKVVERLSPGGYYFAGHSESLQAMNLPLIAVSQAVYRKVGT